MPIKDFEGLFDIYSGDSVDEIDIEDMDEWTETDQGSLGDQLYCFETAEDAKRFARRLAGEVHYVIGNGFLSHLNEDSVLTLISPKYTIHIRFEGDDPATDHYTVSYYRHKPND